MEEKVVRNDSLIPEKKEVKKVVSGTVKTKKKSEIHKLTDVFVSEDIENVKSYIVSDVIIPTIKNTIVDIVTNGVNMLFFGETVRTDKKRNPASRVSYQRYYDKKDDRRDTYTRSRSVRTGYYYDDIILETRGEAEGVLDALNELIDNYSVATVADLNELVGITGQYTDNRYGWTDLHRAAAVRCRDGYELQLPKAMPID